MPSAPVGQSRVRSPRFRRTLLVTAGSLVALLILSFFLLIEPESGAPRLAPAPTTSAPTKATPSRVGSPPDSGGPTGGAPSRTPNPSTDPLEDFVRECETATTKRVGQLSFPNVMRLRVGESDAYSAVVDVRASPGPPEREIDSPDPRSETIKVECVLSARLIPVSKGIEVVPSADVEEGGWRTQEFTTHGLLEWSWTVKPVDPGKQRLRLDLKPAVVVDSDLRSRHGTGGVSYLTDVQVDATAIERASYWFGTQWKLLASIAAVLGTALLAVLAFSNNAKEASLKLFKRNSAPKAEPTVPVAQAKKGKKRKKRH